jgi:hypothetical protein
MKSYRIVGILLLVIAVLYLPFLGNEFISDDIPGLVQAAPAWTWLTSVGWPNYVHLFAFFQYVLYHIFGMTPWPYRLLNILFHAGSAIFVYLIGKKLVGKQVARVAALLFAVHPLATEAVTWISGGNYAQHTFFLLVALWLYMKKTVRTYIGALVFFLLCLATSEKTISLFLVFLAYEWFYGNLRKQWKKVLPFVAMSMIFMVFYGLKIGERTQSLSALTYQSHFGLMNPLLQLPVAISSYFGLFLWPAHLTLYHSVYRFSLWNFSIRAVVTVLYAAFLVYTLVKRKPIGFWMSWFLIGLAPTLTPLRIGWVVAERYVYFSLIGFCVLAGELYEQIVSHKLLRVAGMCVGIIILVALCRQTVIRNSEWRTADGFWVATLRESPEDPKSWFNIGDVYDKHGEYEKSIEAFTHATTINPNYADAYHNIGKIYFQMTKYDEAAPYFEKALAINPSLSQSYVGLAKVAALKGDYQKAIGFIKQAQAINPTDTRLQQMSDYLHRAILGQ